VSDESDMEKTEDATPKKRQDARDEGNLPKSAELTSAVLLIGSAMVLQNALPGIGRHLMNVFGAGLYSAAASPLEGQGAINAVQGLGWRTMAVLSVTLLSMAGVALAIAAAQARGFLGMKPLGPDFNKLNPAQNVKRMIGVTPLAEGAKSIAKVLIVGLACKGTVIAAWPDMLALSQESPMSLMDVVRRHSFALLMHAGLAFLALAAADYLYQVWRHEKSLKMTKQEVKMESKQSDGDPMVKHRMRSLGRAMIRKQMLRDVPKADVVIVNPVHIAVALKYDAMKAPAPYVLAVGQRKVALRIKQIAFEAGVPVVENKPVARALIAARVEPGTMIPAELYAAVAEVLAFVIKQRRLRNGWKGEAVA